jgi:hypothetical protein
LMYLQAAGGERTGCLQGPHVAPPQRPVPLAKAPTGRARRALSSLAALAPALLAELGRLSNASSPPTAAGRSTQSSLTGAAGAQVDADMAGAAGERLPDSAAAAEQPMLVLPTLGTARSDRCATSVVLTRLVFVPGSCTCPIPVYGCMWPTTYYILAAKGEHHVAFEAYPSDVGPAHLVRGIGSTADQQHRATVPARGINCALHHLSHCMHDKRACPCRP